MLSERDGDLRCSPWRAGGTSRICPTTNSFASARKHGVNPKTVAKWRNRDGVEDLSLGPHERRSTPLTPLEEAAIVAFRMQPRLPLDDVFCVLKPDAGKPRRYGFPHPFGQLCRACGIELRLTKLYHPWTNGQAERMIRTLKEATVRPTTTKRSRSSGGTSPTSWPPTTLPST
jgi:hypothetical protein